MQVLSNQTLSTNIPPIHHPKQLSKQIQKDILQMEEENYKFIFVQFKGRDKNYTFIDELQEGANIGDVIIFQNIQKGTDRFGIVVDIRKLPKGLDTDIYPYPPQKTTRISGILNPKDSILWKIQNGFI